MRQYLFDGQKSIALDQFSPDAWTNLSGEDKPAQATISSARALVGVLHRCLDIRRNAITQIPWEISSGDTTLWSSEDKECPPKLKWLEQLPGEFLSDTELMLCLRNQAYILKKRNRAGMLGLQWLAAKSMTPEWDKANGLIGFTRTLSSTDKMSFLPEDILYIWRRDPEQETEPDVSAVEAALSAANVIHGLDLFVNGYFERGGVKLTLFGVPESTSPTERDRFNSTIGRMYQGVKGAWKHFTFNMDQINPVTIGDGLGELHNDALVVNRQHSLVATLGVPLSKIFSNAANYATADMDNQAFYQDTLLPDAELISRQVNRQLLNPLGLHWQFLPEAMGIFQEDEEQRSVSFAQYVGAGLPIAIAAEMLGLTLPSGMEYSDLTPAVPEIVTVAPAPPTPPLPPAVLPDMNAKAIETARFRKWASNPRRKNSDPDDFSSDVLSRAEKVALLAEVSGGTNFLALPSGRTTHKATLSLDPDNPEAERDARMKIERKAERAIADGLQTQQTRVVKSLPKTSDGFAEWAREDLENALKHGMSEAELQDALRRALIDGVDLGVSVAVKQFETIGYGFDWTLANTTARDYANQYTFELIQDINQTTRKRMQQAVTQWIDNGDPLSVLVSELESTFGGQRARTIASTEVTRAYAEAQRISYTQAGVTHWVWTTVLDELVCPICGPLNETVVSINTDFNGFLPDDVQHLAKQQFSAPPAHPQCRCFLRPVIGF